MRPLRTVLLALAVLLVAALPATAGYYYEAVTTTEPQQGSPQRMEVRGWIDGEKAKIEFQDSTNAMMPSGTYLLTEDGGKTLFLVNPEEKTYSHWDLEGMLQTANAMIEGMGGMVKMQFSDPEVEKLLDEPGEAILGYPTRHYRFRTAYSMKIKVLGMGRANDVETVQDIWSSKGIDDPAFGVWLRKEPLKTGNEEMDRLIASQVPDIEGFPLHTVATTTTVGGKRGQQRNETRTETTVNTLRQEAIPAGTFALPEGYTETQMMPTAEDDEDGGSPFKGLFKRGDG